MALTADDIEGFVRDGYVRVAGAFSPELAEQCAAELWTASGLDRDDASTWTSPVVRIEVMTTPAFVAAANTPELLSAFDQLVGQGKWLPRKGLGTFPLRFPHPLEPDDAGWHLEASFAGPDGLPRLSLRSHHRALLMLFLFSEVGPDDAPTRIRVGSHLLAPAVLAPYGDDGAPWLSVCEQVVPASEHLPVVSASGSPGDVFLCHPFLIHAAQPHRGQTPRFMAQPPLYAKAPLDLESANPSPVARAVLGGLPR
jgi:hypothetical protein